MFTESRNYKLPRRLTIVHASKTKSKHAYTTHFEPIYCLKVVFVLNMMKISQYRTAH